MNSETKKLSSLTRPELILLFLLAMVQFTHIMDFMIVMPMGPQLMRLFEITPRQFGFLVSAYTYTAGITGIAGAFFIDRFDRKTALLIAYIGFAMGTLACAIAPTYIFLLMARSLAGAFGGVLGALIFSVVGDAIAFEKRGRAMGIVMASFSMASVLGVPSGIYLATRISWHAPFVLVGMVAIINLALLFFFMKPMRGHLLSRQDRPHPMTVLSGIASDRNQVLALLFMIFLMMSQFMLIPFFSPSMVANVGFAETDLPYIYFFGGFMTIFTSPLVGRMTDKFGKAPVFTVAALMLLVPCLIITHLGPTPMWVALLVTTAFFICGNGRFIPAMAMITSTVKPATRGSFMSINSSVQSLSSGTAALVGGLIVEKGIDGKLLHYNQLGYLSVGLSLTAIYLGRKLKPVDVDQPPASQT